MEYKCIIFDLDGTILDTEEMNLVPLQRLIKEELNMDVSYESLLKYRAYAGEKTLSLLGFKDIEKSYPKWVKYVNEYEHGAKLYDGFKEVIEKLHEKGIVLCIASSKTREQYKIDFEKTDLHKYMTNVVLAEDTENHKPHPEPLLKAVENLNINPNESIYVGDTLADFKASNLAGMDFALAVWGASDLEGIKA
ncbi:MAG: HAD family hydrolase, partial [Clostridium sp.]|uniref:HAD family hydrolase n=1 Tax=Clostridium sp. TaxID=1506 RepID=UPI003F2EE506